MQRDNPDGLRMEEASDSDVVEVHRLTELPAVSPAAASPVVDARSVLAAAPMSAHSHGHPQLERLALRPEQFTGKEADPRALEVWLHRCRTFHTLAYHRVHPGCTLEQLPMTEQTAVVQLVGTYLKEDAYSWWISVNKKLVSWEQFELEFRNFFRSTEPGQANRYRLEKVKQRWAESTSHFNQRFLSACLRIPGLSEQEKLHRYTSSLFNRDALKVIMTEMAKRDPPEKTFSGATRPITGPALEPFTLLDAMALASTDELARRNSYQAQNYQGGGNTLATRFLQFRRQGPRMRRAFGGTDRDRDRPAGRQQAVEAQLQMLLACAEAEPEAGDMGSDDYQAHGHGDAFDAEVAAINLTEPQCGNSEFQSRVRTVQALLAATEEVAVLDEQDQGPRRTIPFGGRGGGRGGRDRKRPLPADIAALPPAEKRRRMDQKLCLRCGRPGHLWADCRSTPKN